MVEFKVCCRGPSGSFQDSVDAIVDEGNVFCPKFISREVQESCERLFDYGYEKRDVRLMGCNVGDNTYPSKDNIKRCPYFIGDYQKLLKHTL